MLGIQFCSSPWIALIVAITEFHSGVFVPSKDQNIDLIDLRENTIVQVLYLSVVHVELRVKGNRLEHEEEEIIRPSGRSTMRR